MHTVFALLCFVVVIHWLIFSYPSGLLHWHCGNLTIAPVPAKQPWWIWINTSCEFIMNDCVTTTKQSTTKPCAYFLGYTVYEESSPKCFSKRKWTHYLRHRIIKIEMTINNRLILIHTYEAVFTVGVHISFTPQAAAYIIRILDHLSWKHRSRLCLCSQNPTLVTQKYRWHSFIWVLPTSIKHISHTEAHVNFSFLMKWEIPWNPIEFNETACVLEIGKLEVPQNSMEFHATEFHGNTGIIENWKLDIWSNFGLWYEFPLDSWYSFTDILQGCFICTGAIAWLF